MKTQKAIRECAEWLAYCLKIGWPKSGLDRLEAIWWKFHDDAGRFIAVALLLLILPALTHIQEVIL